MGRRYTPEEDAFILTHYKVGLRHIAEHDLDRTAASVRSRFKHLTDTGARLAYAQSQKAWICFGIGAGHHTNEFTFEQLNYWRSEVDCLSRPQEGE